MRKAVGAAIVALVFGATACGRPAVVSPAEQGSDARRDAIRALSSRSGADRIAPWYHDVGELLPNTRYAAPGEQPRAVTSRAYVGRVVEVVAGKGFWVPEGDAPGGTMIDFDDPRAMWKTVHLRTEVVRSLDRVSEVGASIWVGLAAEEEPAKLAEGFSQLGSLVFFLYEGSPVFDYDPTLAAIVEDGTMVATIDEDGRLALPFLEEGRSEPLLAGYETLDDLIDQADEPDRVIELEREGGMLVRAD